MVVPWVSHFGRCQGYLLPRIHTKLIERFDRKDPELHFRELAQLKQIGSLEAYISEFERVAVIVSDISEGCLVIFFVDGIMDPLRGWLEAYKPKYLQDVVNRSWDM
jgi:hypothetical protein